MIRLPPRSTRTDTLCPYTTLFRSRPLSVSHRNLDDAERRPALALVGEMELAIFGGDEELDQRCPRDRGLRLADGAGDEGPIGGEQLSFAIGQCRHHARLADPVAGLARDEPARVANEVHILRTTERPQQMGSGEAGAFDGEAESEAGVAQLEIGRAHV